MRKTIIFLGLWLALLTGCATSAGNESAGTATAVPPTVTLHTGETAVFTPTSITTLAPTAVPPTRATQTNLPQPEFSTATPLPPTATPTPPQLLLGAARQLGRGQILDAAFLPDGDTFAIALGWANGVSLVTLDGQELWWQPTDALLVALTADEQGAHIAAILESGAVIVYAADSGVIQQTAVSPPHVYWSDLAFSPDGRWLAYQSIGPNRGDPIFLLDVTSGAVSEIPRSRINSGVQPLLVWSPDGATITLAALNENCPRLLDATSGENQLTLRSDAGCYLTWGLAFAPDGGQIAVAHPEGGVDLLQPDGGQVMAQLTGDVLIAPDQTAPSLLFDPNGRWLATGGGHFWGTNYAARVWEVATGTIIAERLTEFTHTSGRRLALTFADSALMGVYSDGRITRWPFAEDGAEEATIGQIPVVAPYLDLRWAANGERLAAPLTFGGVAVWDVAQSDPIAQFPAPLTDPALSPDGRWLALRQPDQRKIHLYEVDSGDVVAIFPDADSLPAGDPFSPNGRWLAYGADNQLRLVGLDGGETAVLPGDAEGEIITRVIWSAASDALVAASADPNEPVGQVVLWEQGADGAFVATYQGESVRAGYTCCVILAAFSPDGQQVAFEFAPDFEASSLVVAVYDREQATAVLHLEEYELLTWLDDDHLLTHEAQYETKFTAWEVGNGRATVSSKSTLGDEVFAPSGGFYVHPSYAGPNIGRAVRVGHWLHRGVTQDDNVGNDMGVIRWSPDGRWLAALASDSSLWLWPVTLPQP